MFKEIFYPAHIFSPFARFIRDPLPGAQQTVNASAAFWSFATVENGGDAPKKNWGKSLTPSRKG